MKARIQNSVSARCGSTCPRRRTYTRSGGAERMSKREKCVAFSVREGGTIWKWGSRARKLGGLSRKLGGMKWKQGSRKWKEGDFERKSTTFLIRKGNTRKIQTFFLQESHDYPKEKHYICAWQNTTFPFPVVNRHRYSATSMDYSPMVQHKRSLTYCKIPILHRGASGYQQKAKFRN